MGAYDNQVSRAAAAAAAAIYVLQCIRIEEEAAGGRSLVRRGWP